MRVATGLADLDAQVIECRRCPRLVEWREDVARVKRASYADEDYWGRPVPGFGASDPLIWVVGLAPAAHGANRTGRMFTGDRSGDWLFASLHRVGLATQPTSVRVDDGQALRGVRLTAAVHCAPPGNKPTPEEFAACAGWLRAELGLVAPTAHVVVALGGLAWSAALAAMRADGWQVPRPAPRFGHGAEATIASDGREVVLLGAYHPSQQNTFTGRLTEPMLDAVLGRAAQLAGS
ncbi:MAG: uracil-DNA glycosylase [Actinomycetota bacterium]|nr:uracil-DNA glycosylase [Actinomycetota bacterium]